jgi:hypothetical protein
MLYNTIHCFNFFYFLCQHMCPYNRGKELERNTFNSGGHQEEQQQYDNTKGGDNGEQQQQQKTAARSAVADHPSWAAKQAQTTGIVAFKGKKITF